MVLQSYHLNHETQKIKAKGHYTYEYISKVKGQGRQYRHTADLDFLKCFI